MNAVDIWLVVAAVLFGIATVVALLADNPRLTTSHITAMPFIAGGLLSWVISALVARN